MAARKKAMNFEESLAALEALVEQLESGDLSLENALKSYEQGVKLTRECQQALREAEQKVAVLSENSQGLQSTPFTTEEDAPESEGDNSGHAPS